MNTNLIVALIILPATNWTSFQYEGAELGLIRSNHIARIEYAGKTNEAGFLTSKLTYAPHRTQAPTRSRADRPHGHQP